MTFWKIFDLAEVKGPLRPQYDICHISASSRQMKTINTIMEMIYKTAYKIMFVYSFIYVVLDLLALDHGTFLK